MKLLKQVDKAKLSRLTAVVLLLCVFCVSELAFARTSRVRMRKKRRPFIAQRFVPKTQRVQRSVRKDLMYDARSMQTAMRRASSVYGGRALSAKQVSNSAYRVKLLERGRIRYVTIDLGR